MSNAIEEYTKYFDGLSFSGKMEEIKKLKSLSSNICLSTKVSALRFDGYLAQNESVAVRDDSGEYYVYIWKHAWGDPFYVGSGTGDRWKNKVPRCDDFYLHLNSGDAVVYKVLDGVDSKTARLYERYVSANISSAGYILTNSDNNVARRTVESRKRLLDRCGELQGAELTKMVEDAVFEILQHDPICDYRITTEFLKQYGTDFFSRNYSSIAV